jgi:hypothetical protein
MRVVLLAALASAVFSPTRYLSPKPQLSKVSAVQAEVTPANGVPGTAGGSHPSDAPSPGLKPKYDIDGVAKVRDEQAKLAEKVATHHKKNISPIS